MMAFNRVALWSIGIMATISFVVGGYSFVVCSECKQSTQYDRRLTGMSEVPQTINSIPNPALTTARPPVTRPPVTRPPSNLTQIVLVFPLRDRMLHYVWQMNHLRTITRPTWNLTKIVVEQGDREPFRRGWLLNIGIIEATRHFADDTCIVTHDIDYAAAPTVDYAWCDGPTQPCSEISCFNGGVPYSWFCGGVLSMRLGQWRRMNGYTNNASGWGAEDDELYYRARQSGVLKAEAPRRLPAGQGRCFCMDGGVHTARTKHMPAYQSTMQQMEAIRQGSNVWLKDGLNNTHYAVVRHSFDEYGTDWITVLQDIPAPQINYTYLLG